MEGAGERESEKERASERARERERERDAYITCREHSSSPYYRVHAAAAHDRMYQNTDTPEPSQ